MDDDNHNTTSDYKGKGKDDAPSPLTPDQDDGTEVQFQRLQEDHSASSNRSLAARIATSAANLSKSALTSRPDDFPGMTVEKAQSGSSSAADLPKGQTATYHNENGTGSGATQAFSRRQHLSTAEYQYTDFKDVQSDIDASSLAQQLEAAQLEAELTIPVVSHQLSVTSAVSSQEARDGHQVTDLLNIPGVPGDEDSDNGLQLDLSPQAEASLKKALFGASGERTTSNWTTLLDFEPDFLQQDNPAGIQQHLGDVDPQHARSLWVDGWSEVLTSYTDDVWGDLDSLAREAQRELANAQGHAQGNQGLRVGDMKALQRLRQILAHVRGSC
ncbi:uncharacterized protein CTRU02_208861 [Colletotrichum truncatum]|uniref:Uncharacterized protein n=1 Tax=Colletotrichum truncatum TaxID=5467 RepID=A0ACC3YXG0_COLTU|nr:uncharacterized protein CTRU02_06478 [Colletotrichum truncatum]KAF6792395.1 hypothetical protein CTRU02_06478 [Colletotrichum truncatum]